MKHTEIASELFSKRYYCSQAVLAAFAEELGMTKEQALRVGVCARLRSAERVRVRLWL